MKVILAARRTCPVCKREMFIDNGKAVKMPAESAKKLPHRIPRKAKWTPYSINFLLASFAL